MKARPILEKAIQNAILAWLSYQPGCFAFPIKKTGIYDSSKKVFRKSFNKFDINGVPDILGIWNGRPLAIEVKRKGGKVSPDQSKFLDRWAKDGGIDIVAYSVDDLVDKLKFA